MKEMGSLDAALEAFFFERMSSFLAIATATCVVYDHVTTLDVEIEYIWDRSKLTVVQVLFFINRYLGNTVQIYSAFVLVHHFTGHSHESYLSEGDMSLAQIILFFGGMMVTFSMHGILLFRVSSMYSHTRHIVYFLTAGYAMEVMTIFLVLVIAIPFRISVPDPVAPLGIHLCTLLSFPRWTYYAWLPVILFETFVMTFSFKVALEYHRSVRHLSRLSLPATRMTKLSGILCRDSLTYPVIYCILCIINFSAAISESPAMARALLPITSCAPCIIGPRLILNLREAYYLPFTEECNIMPEELFMEVALDGDEGESIQLKDLCARYGDNGNKR